MILVCWAKLITFLHDRDIKQLYKIKPKSIPNPHSFYACGLAAVHCVPDEEIPQWYAVRRQDHEPFYPIHETADLSMNAPQ